MWPKRKNSKRTGLSLESMDGLLSGGEFVSERSNGWLDGLLKKNQKLVSVLEEENGRM